jgi:hypothetical protein
MNSRHRSKEKLVPIWKEIHFLLTFFLWNTEFLKWVVTPETDVHPILQMCSLFHRVGKETKSQDYQVKYFFIKQMHEHTFRCKTTSLPFHTKLPEKKKSIPMQNWPTKDSMKVLLLSIQLLNRCRLQFSDPLPIVTKRKYSYRNDYSEASKLTIYITRGENLMLLNL